MLVNLLPELDAGVSDLGVHNTRLAGACWIMWRSQQLPVVGCASQLTPLPGQMQHESIPLRAMRNSKKARGKCKPTLCSLIPPGFWRWRAWLWVAPSPNCLYQHLQPFIPWPAEDLGAGCCPMLCHCDMGAHSHSIPLVFPRWPGNDYTWKEMRTEKQW